MSAIEAKGEAAAATAWRRKGRCESRDRLNERAAAETGGQKQRQSLETFRRLLYICEYQIYIILAWA
jgi:hypothetical protein